MDLGQCHKQPVIWTRATAHDATCVKRQCPSYVLISSHSALHHYDLLRMKKQLIVASSDELVSYDAIHENAHHFDKFYL